MAKHLFLTISKIVYKVKFFWIIFNLFCLALSTMFDNSEEADAKDNVVAATCRILMYYPTLVPFD